MSSLTVPPTRFDANTSANSLGDTDAGRYALVLAALAEVAGAEMTPALTMLNALVADIADGQLDGEDDGTPLTVPYSDFLTDTAAAITTVASQFANSALQANANAQRPISSDVSGGNNGGGGDNGEVVTGTLNAGLVGTYELVAGDAATGSPFANGEMVTAAVDSAGTLQINDGAVLTDPFYRVFGEPNEAEIIWLDEASNYEYALTDNTTGNFNEINVGDAANPGQFGIPTFLVQLRLETTGGGADGVPTQLAAIAGDYEMTVVQNTSFSVDQGYPLDQASTLSINGETGVVTFGDNISIAPGDTGYMFNDRSDGPSNARGYGIRSTPDGTNELRLFIYLREGAVVAAGVRQKNGNSFQNMVVEPRPVASNVQAVFSDLLSERSVTLTVVEDDTTYSGGLGDLCNTFTFDFQDGSGLSGSFSDVPFNMRADDSDSEGGIAFAGEIYRARDSFVTVTGGVTSLIMESLRVDQLAGGTIELAAIFLDNVRDRASNDPAAIAAAGCGTGSGGSTELGAGQSGMSYQVGGASFVVENAAVLANTPNFDYNTLNVGPGGSLTQFFRFPNETGSYRCGEGPSFRNFYIVFNHQGTTYRGAAANTTEPAGSSCDFVVTQVGTDTPNGSDYTGTVEANFSGTFIADDNSQVVVTNGFVRGFGNMQ